MIDLTTVTEPTEDDAFERLNGVIDPEIGIGIVDLGLVYDVSIDGAAIVVTMTMTTPACPLGAYLQRAVEESLADLAGQRLIDVPLVFDPPWTTDMITPQGRDQLGWRG